MKYLKFNLLIFIVTLTVGLARSQTANYAPTFTIKKNGFFLPKIGDQAVDFLQHDVKGKPVKLSDFKGKYLLLDFWGSMCAPCRRSHPHLRELYTHYKNKNFTILSVSTYDIPEGKQRWLKAIADDKLTWTQVSDPRNYSAEGEASGGTKGMNEAAAKYGVTSLPRNFLIGPGGKIIGIDLHGADLDAALTKVL